MGIAVNPILRQVYVACKNQFSNIGGTVSIIDTATNTVLKNVTLGTASGGSTGVAVSPDGKKVYATNYDDGTVSVIDTATNTVIATVPVKRHPVGVSVTPDNKKVYVANQHANTISIIDTTTNKVINTVRPGGLSPISFGQFIGNYPIGNEMTPTKTTLTQTPIQTSFKLLLPTILVNLLSKILLPTILINLLSKILLPTILINLISKILLPTILVNLISKILLPTILIPIRTRQIYQITHLLQ